MAWWLGLNNYISVFKKNNIFAINEDILQNNIIKGNLTDCYISTIKEMDIPIKDITNISSINKKYKNKKNQKVNNAQ